MQMIRVAMLQSVHMTSTVLPYVSARRTVKSFSLASCLCPNDPTKGIDEGVIADECAELLADDKEGGKRAGLHGEWEF
jgi:hypothetical protein